MARGTSCQPERTVTAAPKLSSVCSQTTAPLHSHHPWATISPTSAICARSAPSYFLRTSLQSEARRVRGKLRISIALMSFRHRALSPVYVSATTGPFSNSRESASTPKQWGPSLLLGARPVVPRLSHHQSMVLFFNLLYKPRRTDGPLLVCVLDLVPLLECATGDERSSPGSHHVDPPTGKHWLCQAFRTRNLRLILSTLQCLRMSQCTINLPLCIMFRV